MAVQPHRAAVVPEEEVVVVPEERAHLQGVPLAETKMPLMEAAGMAVLRVARVAAGVARADAIGMAAMQTDVRALMAPTEARVEREAGTPQAADLQLLLL
jgi:hypothetical protein